MNFDRLAPHYDWLETLAAGDRLQRIRTAWLEALQGRRRILSVGEGHGRFATACSLRHPEAMLTCVDASPRMLARAQERMRGRSNCITWHCRDIADWLPPVERFDAIVTCFFLDCFAPEQLSRVVAKLAACAADDAVWIVADFAVPGRGLARWRAQAVHALMYGFFRITAGLSARRLTPPDEVLQAHGFTLVGRKESDWGLLRADRWRRGDPGRNDG